LLGVILEGSIEDNEGKNKKYKKDINNNRIINKNINIMTHTNGIIWGIKEY